MTAASPVLTPLKAQDRDAIKQQIAPICGILGQLVINCPCEHNGGSARRRLQTPPRAVICRRRRSGGAN